LDFLLALLLDICPLGIFFFLLFDVIFIKMSQSLDHGVNLFVIFIHKHLFEWPLGWEVKSLEQVSLATLVERNSGIEYFDLLLGLERKSLVDSLGDLKRSKDSLISFAIYVLIMNQVFGVLVELELDASLLSELSMGFEESSSSISDDLVTESGNINLIPGPQENNVTLEDLVLKRGPERAVWSSFLDCLLDRTSDTRNRFNLGSDKFSYLKTGVEHSFDKGCVFHNFIWITNQLQLFHYLEFCVKLDHNACHTKSEMCHIFLVSIFICLI
jgi:hypothetical protein